MFILPFRNVVRELVSDCQTSGFSVAISVTLSMLAVITMYAIVRAS